MEQINGLKSGACLCAWGVLWSRRWWFICAEPGNTLHCPTGTPCMWGLSHPGTETKQWKLAFTVKGVDFSFSSVPLAMEQLQQILENYVKRGFVIYHYQQQQHQQWASASPSTLNHACPSLATITVFESPNLPPHHHTHRRVLVYPLPYFLPVWNPRFLCIFYYCPFLLCP